MYWLYQHWPQFAIVLLLLFRAAAVIRADLWPSRRKVTIHEAVISEMTYAGLFVLFLWAGGFWK